VSERQDMGASAEADRATRPTDQAAARLGDTASVPSAAGLRFCKDCKHCSGARPLVEYCYHPASYQGGDFDLISGRDGRRFKECHVMRREACGRAATMFEPLTYVRTGA
jgi:hypothetical protein